MRLVLPCWSRCTIVAIAVDILICVWGWSLICLLSWTHVSIVPNLPTTIAWSHNTRILCIVVPLRWRWCRSRSLEVGALNLSLRRLKSFNTNLHSGLSDLLTWTEDRSLRGRTITDTLVASLSSSALHLPHTLHNSSSDFKD
jgi:hypothetical protein